MIKNEQKTGQHESVQDYYGRVLKSKDDLKTSACCDATSFPDYLKKPMSLLSDEILDKFYGCGSPLPTALKGCKVLDLGCGTGRDVYLASYLVGETGEVHGVDMTDEQLDIAQKYQAEMAEKFGHKKSNVKFYKGFIENLDTLNLPDDYFDIVISNCVLNLSPQKDQVLKQVYRVLKKGGEFYFSDVYSDRRLPEHFKEDAVLLGECLGGALYWKDFERLAIKTGFMDPRVFSSRILDITNEEVAEKIGMTEFYSVGYRLFKLDDLEDACEDFGHQAKYLGNDEFSPDIFSLDDEHEFEKNQVYPICGNTYKMITESRFKKYFAVEGDFSTHRGLFDCGPGEELDDEEGHEGACSGPGCC